MEETAGATVEPVLTDEAVTLALLSDDAAGPSPEKDEEVTAALAAAIEEAAEEKPPSADGITPLRPRARPGEDAAAELAEPAEETEVVALPQEPTLDVVTRLSTSGGRHWSINIGRYSSRYEAERVLLQTALGEIETLDEALRKVVRKPTGFDANFVGLSQGQAQLACARLAARNRDCTPIGPS